MRTRIKQLIWLAAIGIASTACNVPGTNYDVTTGKLTVVQLHAEWETEVNHPLWEMPDGARLDIIMWPDDMGVYRAPAQYRCDHMGGTLKFYQATHQTICEGVDY